MELHNKIRHGSPEDRGSADRYYGRPMQPHYFEGATHQSKEVTKEKMTEKQINEYVKAYENETNRKIW
tara:strand:+ start:1470 stop:1673 length:204 start_codon:yes stop_codon:yes gene_type:complete